MRKKSFYLKFLNWIVVNIWVFRLNLKSDFIGLSLDGGKVRFWCEFFEDFDDSTWICRICEDDYELGRLLLLENNKMYQKSSISMRKTFVKGRKPKFSDWNCMQKKEIPNFLNNASNESTQLCLDWYHVKMFITN